LKIPKSLEKNLPYASKQKNEAPKEKIKRPALIGFGSEKERATANLIVQLNTMKNEKIAKQKAKKTKDRAAYQKKQAEEKKKLEENAKIARKRVFKAQTIDEKRKKRKLNPADE
jgi:hypothetical protein